MFLETIQTSTILKVLIAKIIHVKVNLIWHMLEKKLRNGLIASSLQKEAV